MTGPSAWGPAPTVEPATEYPSGYRRCPTCGAYIGAPCTSAAGRIEAGQPVGGATALDRPHRARKVRAGW